ncbi:MAG: hypothetical protein DGJ47_000841 [Rickettsiaceae bacterium]
MKVIKNPPTFVEAVLELLSSMCKIKTKTVGDQQNPTILFAKEKHTFGKIEEENLWLKNEQDEYKLVGKETLAYRDELLKAATKSFWAVKEKAEAEEKAKEATQKQRQ